MAFATLGGLRLHYERHGEGGPPIVFVHGYTGDATDWVHQIGAFAGDHRVLVLDNRGHGESEAPTDRDAYSVDAMVADALGIVDEVGLDRFHLVGHSMGGAIAQEIALREPERLISVTLEDTSHSFADHGEPGGTRPVVSPEELRIATERVARMSRDALVGSWKGLLGWRGTTDRAQAIDRPTLIVYGARDASRIVEGSRKLEALIPGAQLVEIEDAGHSPQRERPDVFNGVLRRFLRAAS
jgi:pimeloyl-ACP methyl ester carboxylesterase